MLTVEEMKRRACETIEKRKKEIIEVAQQVLSHPEAGFREHRTSSLVAQKFNELQIPHDSGLALTGLKGRISGGAGSGPTVALIGELDSLVVTEHPYADPETGAAHAQLAVVAAGMRRAGLGVGVRVLGYNEGVQLTDEGHRGA